MLANGAGKSRMRPNATGRPVATWRLIFLSSGEVGLVEKLNEIGHQVRAGQEVRVLDVPADAGAGLGAFEQLHGSADGAAFANRIKQATATHCAHAAHAFLERITAGSLEELATAVRSGLERWVGFRKKDRDGRWEFYAMPEGFKEMTKGFNFKKLAADLIRAGILSPAGDGKSQKTVRVSNLPMKLYHFPASALASEASEGDDA